MALIDQFGQAIPKGEGNRTRMRALIGGSNVPYDASDTRSAEMEAWNPFLGSPDTETNPYRDRVVSRARDLVRNDGWASGAVTRISDATVGADMRPSARPDYRGLAQRFGGSFDAAWAKEFAAASEGIWRAWAYDPARYCDLARQLTIPQMFRLAFRHLLVEGEALAVMPWRPDRVGYGRARYATTLQLVDPDRLSNPQLRPDSITSRGGVEIDEDGAPIAYHIRAAHMAEWWAAGQTVTWDRVPRETAWGRPMTVHHFERDRTGQHRPVGGIFTPVLARLRMIFRYDTVELQAAVINAIFGAYVSSPYDPADVEAGLRDPDEMSEYQNGRADFHKERGLMAGNARLATLYPGEEIKTISATRPVSAFDAFEGAMLRNVATALGISYETASGDYRGSTYSSARQAMLESYKTLDRRMMEFGTGFASPVYSAVMEEAFENGELPLPTGAPDFAEAKAEYTRCKWLGVGKGWIDPSKEIEAARMRIASGLSSLERESSDIVGTEYEETLDQLAMEKAEIEARGLTLQFDNSQKLPEDANPKADTNA